MRYKDGIIGLKSFNSIFKSQDRELKRSISPPSCIIYVSIDVNPKISLVKVDGNNKIGVG